MKTYTLKTLRPLRNAYRAALAKLHAASGEVGRLRKAYAWEPQDPVPADLEAAFNATGAARAEIDAARDAFPYEAEGAWRELTLKHHYFFTEKSWKPSRTYGGGTYILNVWKNEGPGRLRLAGTATACTRGHRGRDHEAWAQVIKQDLPPALLKRMEKDADRLDYIPQGLEGNYGVKITDIS